MKRITVMTLKVLWLWFMLLATATAAERGLLWQVSGNGVEATLFGTMHSEDPRVVSLPSLVEKHFIAADTVVLEVAMDAQTEMVTAMRMMLPPEQSLTQLVGKELSDRAKQAMLSRNIPPEATERLQPWATVLVLSMPEVKTGQALDLVLYQWALEVGKSFKALESAEEQLSIFSSLSTIEQKTILRNVLDEYQSYPELFERMTLAYLARDLTQLVRISNENPMTTDSALQQRLMRSMLEERNHRMVNRMLPYFKEGRSFVAVGALHLPGEEGIIALLRQRGYTVTALY